MIQPTMARAPDSIHRSRRLSLTGAPKWFPLMSCGSAGDYVGKILRATKCSDLPSRRDDSTHPTCPAQMRWSSNQLCGTS